MGDTTAQTFEITRSFQASREKVWRAWTDVDQLAKWWGSPGATWLRGTLDLRPGGSCYYATQMPDGSFTMTGKFVYREICPPEKLVFLSGFANEAGEFARASFLKDWPMTILNTVTFAEHGAVTTVSLRGCPENASDAEMAAFVAMFPGLQQGFSGTFEQLDAFLKTV